MSEKSMTAPRLKRYERILIRLRRVVEIADLYDVDLGGRKEDLRSFEEATRTMLKLVPNTQHDAFLEVLTGTVDCAAGHLRHKTEMRVLVPGTRHPDHKRRKR